MIRPTLAVLVLLVVSALSAGCGAQAQTAASGDVTVELVTSPARPAAMRPATLRLRFSTSGGSAAVRDLTVQARMPEMEHGAEAIAFRPVGPGRFEASHVFSMDGTWELQVRALVQEEVVTTRLIIRVGGE
jgi:nitrogen fixation protein FixH